MMIERLDQSKRKVVVISDPHIRKNDSYFLYQTFMNLEKDNKSVEPSNNQTKSIPSRYLIKDPYKANSDDDSFVGVCWPGASVWPDFIQKKVRQVWATLYAEDILYRSNKNFFAWNDMNEPSVFDRPELTLPKEAL